MAQIYGQIESLKQIRNRLNLKGIDRFNSINDINVFLKNYESEKITLLKQFENELENDINEIKENIKYNHEASENIKKEKIIELDTRIKLNNIVLENYHKKNKNSFLAKFIIAIIIYLVEFRREYLQNNYDNIIRNSTNEIKRKINIEVEKLNAFINNKKNIISERSGKNIEHLEFTKEAVLEINQLIAGAIGENLVANEVRKLSNDYTLINDFSLTFDPPIYNKKENDRIFSIQIDHLLISKSGVYILETKNWSKKSIMSFHLRSPIKQINRTKFALYILMKNSKLKLKKHHWGEKQIPIRSLIVMINNKPKESFKFVKILKLNELNRYIKFFDPIFSDIEYREISRALINLNNSTPNNH